jgi:hypothetical protein
MGTTNSLPLPADPIGVRRALGLARYRVACRAGTTDEIARLYEANRLAVSPRLRAALDLIYAELYAQLCARVAEIGPRESLRLVRRPKYE